MIMSNDKHASRNCKYHASLERLLAIWDSYYGSVCHAFGYLVSYLRGLGDVQQLLLAFTSLVGLCRARNVPFVLLSSSSDSINGMKLSRVPAWSSIIKSSNGSSKIEISQKVLKHRSIVFIYLNSRTTLV